MGIFSKLFGSKKTTEYEKDFDESVFMASHQLADGAQREKFISHTLEQMKEAADEIDILSREYDNVTAYLTDMDEIDRLPEPIAAPIKEHAKKLVKLEQERKHFTGNVIHMTDEEFALMQRFEDEMPEGYEKLKKAEEYQKLVKSDLNRMEGEKQAYFYRRNELEGLLANIKGVFFVCMMAVLVCIVILFILQIGFEMDVRVGYLLAAGAAAVALVVLFVKNMDMQKELRVVEMTICKLIQMQNTIKIRYVNNTNLLDYLYMKFEVNSAKELQVLWDKYVNEKAERERFEKNKFDIGYHRGELLALLKPLPIKDTRIWLHQAEALVNPKEMVEIRHGLIVQRQNLRKQMEYNRENAIRAKQELEDMIHTYPQYASEVLQLMEEFEKRKL